MKKIFSKTSFSLAPGGDRYEWKEAETNFHIGISGLFAIKIEASAKNTIINALDMGEGLGLVHNFEIEIRLKEILC